MGNALTLEWKGMKSTSHSAMNDLSIKQSVGLAFLEKLSLLEGAILLCT